MDDTLQARVQHEIADLRAAYPRITDCRATLEDWDEDGKRQYALRLDIRLPQRQTLLAGAPQASGYAALRAAFDAASRHLAAIAAPGA